MATQTDESIGALFRFRDVAEDTCSAEAVTDALMNQIEEKMDIIKKLEETLAEKNKIIDEYGEIEKDYESSERRRGGEPPQPSSLRTLVEDFKEEREDAWDEATEWEERVDELYEEVDKLKEQMERDSGCEENAKLRKEIEEVKAMAELHDALCVKREDMEEEVATLKRQLRVAESPLAYWGGEAMKLGTPLPLVTSL